MNVRHGTPPPRPSTSAAQNPGFLRRRRVTFAVMLGGFMLSFFHRTAPASIADELTHAFGISGALLGALAATYFVTYTVLQVPVGVLADTVGPRWLMTAGSLVAGVGSLAFALAPAWEVAAAGRTLVGAGVSVAFIAVLKVVAVWFPPGRFATLVGATMFAGNVGAVLAGAPLAWLVTGISWRPVFLALAALSLAIGGAAWVVVRDRPEDAGFAPVNRAPAGPSVPLAWRPALGQVLANRSTWLGFAVTTGIGGSFLAFAGLWATPYLVEVHGLSRMVAAQHVSLLLVGVAVGSVIIGALSDRIGSRTGLMKGYATLYVMSWAPWLLGVRWPTWATSAWFLLMGLLIPTFTLCMTVAKEANRPEHSGIATSVVNVGVFLGAAILQPMIGWRLDRGRAAGDLRAAWSQAILMLAIAAALGLAGALAHRARTRLGPRAVLAWFVALFLA